MARVGALAKGLLIYSPECPYCQQGRIGPIGARGFWERRIFPLFRIWRVRCEVCRARFYRFLPEGGWSRKAVGEGREGKNIGPGTPEKESVSGQFEELISEVAQAERERFGPPEESFPGATRRSGSNGSG